MTNSATAWLPTKLFRIAFAASLSISLGACKGSNLESLSPSSVSAKTMMQPNKPGSDGAQKSKPRAKPSGKIDESQGVASAPEAKQLVAIARPDAPAKSRASRRQAWGTVYYIQAARAYSGDGGVSLRGPAGQSLGASLSVRDFCRAAREGTVTVSGGKAVTFNHAGWTDRPQTDCSKVFPRVRRDEVARFERTVFEPVPSDAPEGLGSDSRYRLVPYRTVAVDISVFPMGSVLFIPRLKGKKTPIGVHDGYVFAGDTGVGINGPHLDFFLGRTTANPAPDIFTGGPATRFDVELVTDSAVIERLRRQHLR